MFLANHNGNQKPALCSQHCSQLEFYIECPQTSYSFHLCSSKRRAFPWLRGEISSLAAPRSGERQQNNLLCPRAPWCRLRSGHGTGHRPTHRAGGSWCHLSSSSARASGAAADGCARCLRASFCRRKVWWGQHVTLGFAPLERAR